MYKELLNIPLGGVNRLDNAYLFENQVAQIPDLILKSSELVSGFLTSIFEHISGTQLRIVNRVTNDVDCFGYITLPDNSMEIKIWNIDWSSGWTGNLLLTYIKNNNFLLLRIRGSASVLICFSYFNNGDYYTYINNKFYKDGLSFTPTKTNFSKLDINNKNILIPVRVLNQSANKILSSYPLGFYGLNPLTVNDCFYKFIDGEYGYYKDNILYK